MQQSSLSLPGGVIWAALCLRSHPPAAVTQRSSSGGMRRRLCRPDTLLQPKCIECLLDFCNARELGSAGCFRANPLESFQPTCQSRAAHGRRPSNGCSFLPPAVASVSPPAERPSSCCVSSPHGLKQHRPPSRPKPQPPGHRKRPGASGLNVPAENRAARAQPCSATAPAAAAAALLFGAQLQPSLPPFSPCLQNRFQCRRATFPP